MSTRASDAVIGAQAVCFDSYNTYTLRRCRYSAQREQESLSLKDRGLRPWYLSLYG
jgi:hypothetical protein